ncbi:HD domain-containing protein [Spirillospora sp. NPDC047279]|uniref:HD domain-containing protein n=1 Tax=Spirillospora sp. NPDC047279 TaxID=3155478 RepID=UPI0033EBDEC5
METFTSWRTWDEARPELTGLPAADLAVVERAVIAARRWHGDQLRPTGVPYLEHLLEALEVLVRGAGVTSPDLLAAVVLHDVVEDTAATARDVEDEFGPVVAELVDWVTKPPAAGEGRQAKRAAKSAYLRRLGEAPREAKVVKLADRVSNVQRLHQMPPDFQRRYYAETITYVLPLAAAEPWFENWYREWRAEYAHLL